MQIVCRYTKNLKFCPQDPLKKNIKNADVENLGAMFYDLFKEFKQSEYFLNSDSIPNNIKEVSNEDRNENEKLLEKIENDDDVQNIFHNMKD